MACVAGTRCRHGLVRGHGRGRPFPATSRRRGSLRLARGGIRHDFRIAVAASSRYAAHFGGTTKGALAEIVHVVNQANEVFETDVGVHFTLVAGNDRLIRPRPSRDPFRHEDPGPAAANLIDREIGAGNYDIGHALTDYTGGESHVGTSCSDARDADFLATHKAAAWSGHAHPQTATAEAVGFLIHVLGRQLGAWPTAGGCPDATREGRAFEPGSGSTAMGFAPSSLRARRSAPGTHRPLLPRGQPRADAGLAGIARGQLCIPVDQPRQRGMDRPRVAGRASGRSSTYAVRSRRARPSRSRRAGD